MHRTSRGLATLLVAASVLLFAGCMTGERPTLGTVGPTDAGIDTGDVNIDQVLALLDASGSAVFTAQYTATLKFGGTTTNVSVTQEAPSRQSVTIGDTRYVTEPTGTRTCTLSTATCAPGVNPQPVSNTGVTSDLVFGDAAKRLRRSAASRVGATTLTESLIAGQTATCVDLPVGTGVATYCALANGVLARMNEGDVDVEMTAYAATPDATAFDPPATG